MSNTIQAYPASDCESNDPRPANGSARREKAMPYWRQLKDPRWQEKRLQIMQRADFKCESCAAKPEGESLHIHHRYYETGLMCWEYPEEALLCLCETCHPEVAAEERLLLTSLGPKASEINELARAIHFADVANIKTEECSRLIFQHIATVWRHRLADARAFNRSPSEIEKLRMLVDAAEADARAPKECE